MPLAKFIAFQIFGLRHPMAIIGPNQFFGMQSIEDLISQAQIKCINLFSLEGLFFDSRSAVIALSRPLQGLINNWPFTCEFGHINLAEVSVIFDD